MTTITKLYIHQFRNLYDISVEISPDFNILYGLNGSGKTSFLEAIYFLGYGRSFRTSQIHHVIQKNTLGFSIFAQLQSNNRLIPVGIERLHDGQKKTRMDGKAVQNISQLVAHIPIKLISTESYRFFHDGPKLRRQFMDWGVFHVEPTFFPIWQQFQQVLKQRNACIKQRLSYQEITAWDIELGELAKKIDVFRRIYVERLEPVLTDQLKTLCKEHQLSLLYTRGWEETHKLPHLLGINLHKDLQLGYTHLGPHRADLQLLYEGVSAQNFLSQGQQKIVSYALHLAQGILLRQETSKIPIYLIDDLPSELDLEKRTAITHILTALNAQVFITGISGDDLKEILTFEQSKLFHVEHGNILVKAYR